MDKIIANELDLPEEPEEEKNGVHESAEPEEQYFGEETEEKDEVADVLKDLENKVKLLNKNMTTVQNLLKKFWEGVQHNAGNIKILVENQKK